MLIVQPAPALSADGECKADESGQAAYRAEERELESAWTVSRRDIAYFVVEDALADWEK